MSHKLELTDNQWYNFICGFYAGLRLRDLTLPEYDSGFTLGPINVGGSGTIGLMVPEEIKSGGRGSLVVIPVSTHDVDIDYCGFSVAISWDASRLKFKGVTEGLFGSISSASSPESSIIKYTYSDGLFKARGIHEHPKSFGVPTILFYIEAEVIDYVTVDSPIKLNMSTGNFTDLNDTTLLKYVETLPGRYDLFYITPLINKSGVILGDDELPPGPGNNIGDLGDASLSVVESPSGIYILDAYIPRGGRGYFAVVININSNKIPVIYNRARVDFIIHNCEACGFTVTNIFDIFGISNHQIIPLDNGDVRINLEIRYNKYFDGVITAAFGNVRCREPIDASRAPMEILRADLIRGTEEEEVREIYSYAGVLYNELGGGGSYVGGFGGVGGGGFMYSGSSQDVFIQFDDGVSFPIHLEPGWNEVEFFIPSIYPSDQFIDSNIKIYADGYILIPAGFGWEIIPDPNAKPKPPNSKMMDGLRFRDFYLIEVEGLPGPIYIDNISDDLTFEDFSHFDTDHLASVVDYNNIEDASFSDLIHIDVIDTSSGSDIDNNIDDVSFSDLYNLERMV